MKCDKLKVETIVPQGSAITLQMYGKAEVDEAIAKLKAENKRLKEEAVSWMEETTRARNEKMAMFEKLANVNFENECLKSELYAVKTDLAMSQKWRKCSEEMPQNGQDVWAYDSKSKSVLRLEYEKSDEGEGFIVFPYKHDFLQNITQWMPFEKPKAPEEK